MVFTSFHVDQHSGAFQLRIGHLTSHGALPNQVVEPLFLCRALDFAPAHVGGANGFVCFLRALRVRVITSTLVVVRTHQFGDHRPYRIETEVGKIHRVGTHIGDQTRFIELLRHTHGRAHRKTNFTCCFLLQGRRGERRCRTAFRGFRGNGTDGETRIFTPFEEGLCFVGRGKTVVEFGFQLCRLSVGTVYGETRRHTVVAFTCERGDLAFALHDESHRHALHTTGRKTGAHFVPKHRREAETHQAVEHATRLLRIDQIQVNGARMLDGIEDGRFRDFVKHDAARCGRVEFEHFREVPRDGFSLAVLIGSQPDGFALLGLGAQLAHHFFLVIGNYIDGRKSLRVHTEIFFRQIADVAETRHHLKIVAKEALDGFGLRRALHDH